MEASFSLPITKEQEEEEEEIVEVSDSEDDFEVFNQPQSPEIPSGDLGQPFPGQTSQVQGGTPPPKDMGIKRR